VATARYAQPRYEHALPGGAMHLVFRLTDDPLRILDVGRDAQAKATPNYKLLAGAMIGGARSRYYLREMTAPSCSVGAVLRPGAAALLFGAPADEFAERHTPLNALWGSAAASLREQLLDAANAEARLALLEAALLARLPRVCGMHPAIAAMLADLHTLPSVTAAVQRSGLSHRQFIAQFRHAVGLAPKTWLRVRRFQRALQALRHDENLALARLAVEAGYSDQAHFNREFLEFAGVTPVAYQRQAPHEANHLPVDTKDRR
jgi:AraC-like DNA-binding protein